jgi:hypothetical protein
MGFILPGTLAGPGGGGFVSPGAVGFSPGTVPGLIARVFDPENNSYTDASKTTNPSDTNSIRVWEDIDNSLDFTVPAGTAQPTFNATGTGGNIDFDGANDYLAAPNTTLANFGRLDPFSIFIVNQFDSITTTDVLVAKGDRTANVRGYLLFASSTGTDIYFQFQSTVAPSNRIQTHWTNNVSAGTAYWFVFTYDGSSAASGCNLTRNGVAQTRVIDIDTLTGDTTTSVPLNIGNRDNGSQGGEGGDAKFAEFAMYDRVVTAEEITNFGTYVFDTYGF